MIKVFILLSVHGRLFADDWNLPHRHGNKQYLGQIPQTLNPLKVLQCHF